MVKGVGRLTKSFRKCLSVNQVSLYNCLHVYSVHNIIVLFHESLILAKNLLRIKGNYRKSTSIRHFEEYNQQLSNLICQNCDGSIKILLDVGNQQHAV